MLKKSLLRGSFRVFVLCISFLVYNRKHLFYKVYDTTGNHNLSKFLATLSYAFQNRFSFFIFPFSVTTKSVWFVCHSIVVTISSFAPTRAASSFINSFARSVSIKEPYTVQVLPFSTQRHGFFSIRKTVCADFYTTVNRQYSWHCAFSLSSKSSSSHTERLFTSRLSKIAIKTSTTIEFPACL